MFDLNQKHWYCHASEIPFKGFGKCGLHIEDLIKVNFEIMNRVKSMF